MTEQAKKYSAPALDKALDILEYLSEESSPRSQTEIAQGLNRGPNEIYRVLIGLEARGYLIRDDLSGKYRLSLKLYTLSHTHSPIEELRRAAFLPMGELAEKIGQSCHLSVPYKNQLLVVGQVKSPDPVSLSIAEGTLFPLLSTTSGRTLLANFDQESIDRALMQDALYKDMSEKEKVTLAQQLSDIKESGYHLAQSNITHGVTDCAAFIGKPGSGLTAAIAVSSLTSIINQQLDKETIAKAVMETAIAINERIGTVHIPA